MYFSTMGTLRPSHKLTATVEKDSPPFFIVTGNLGKIVTKKEKKNVSWERNGNESLKGEKVNHTRETLFIHAGLPVLF